MHNAFQEFLQHAYSCVSTIYILLKQIAVTIPTESTLVTSSYVKVPPIDIVLGNVKSPFLLTVISTKCSDTSSNIIKSDVHYQCSQVILKYYFEPFHGRLHLLQQIQNYFLLINNKCCLLTMTKLHIITFHSQLYSSHHVIIIVLIC